MACETESERKCFTFIWKVENVSYCWLKEYESIESPWFVVDEIEGTKWRLLLTVRCGEGGNFVQLWLESSPGSKSEENTVFTRELDILALDGRALLSNNNDKSPSKNPTLRIKREDLFVIRKSEFLSQDTLTARVRIWKSDGGVVKNVHSVARTIIEVEKRSFTWKVRDFSSLKPMKVCSYEIKSLETGVPLISLDLFLNDASKSGRICFAIDPKCRTIKCCTFQLSHVQASGNIVECLKDEFRFDALPESKEATQIFKRSSLMENKSEYLPNDILTLQCMCCFSSGIMRRAIEEVSSDSTNFNNNSINRGADKEDLLPKYQKALNNELKSLLVDGMHSDIKLRAKSKSYPAHKCILSARSPVFKAMFSINMREKTVDSVDIMDLNDDTVFRLLQYIYSAEVEKLEWDDAMDLYEAADKYQIITLKDICSSYFKAHLCQTNACAALLLADMHHDEDLKTFAQDFILRHGKNIMNSEEWKELMKINLQLAAETMYLKYQE
ncbi:unnamed protein product [Larinioides sclopetarius]|uniref:Uncharacterized protein n=1 Tax=Larinioides sclopetarius TaxID=280406 RepID=A0AAV2AJ61_9ARAC